MFWRRTTNLLLLNICLFLLIEFFIINHVTCGKSQESDNNMINDDEFAEFEELDDDDDGNGNEFVRPISSSTPMPMENSATDKSQSKSSNQVPEQPKSYGDLDSDPDTIIIEEDDEEEFETVREEIDDERPLNFDEPKKDEIQFTKIPLHLRTSWESYYLEFICIIALAIYFINYIAGRSRNIRIANIWFEKNKDILDYNFALVGDDLKQKIQEPGLLKETENVYTLWCSGRTMVDGMLIEIRLQKRQDLFSTIINYFKPTSDKILIKSFLSADSMDNFVFCIAQRKIASKLSKETNDLATYCPERKNPEKYGITSDNYLLLNEIGEAASFILDSKIVSLLDKNDDLIEFIHISDQFSGARNDETQQSTTKLPEVKKMLIISLNLPSQISSPNMDELDRLKPLLQMAFYMIDKLRRFRLSREKKLKSDRNRQKVEKLFLQSTHQQRQEAAQMKREEKRRAEKEKMLQEMDPEKQRKWEEKEYKREMKKKIPKMKQLKMKAM
ncbi:coiled-coil domain-containing protein 47-like [Dermatophagoides farinae]|uniref:PAT complex subunit CCDC47 n=1 Tax=Dermatophagoides farinae TaxID=6954 RepID=A0A9D4P9I8_DERFA|nr:PAT complex subunit CCDC47-like [Dermatophagoides farinae]KAH7646709.1 coiled-coil domain-containing protein 47-like [Dermatophagoides farinae]